MTPTFQKKKKSKLFFPKISKKSLSLAPRARPSFGMTTTQDIRDLFAKKTYLRSKATEIKQLQEGFVIDIRVKYTGVNNNKDILLKVKCLINNFDPSIKS